MYSRIIKFLSSPRTIYWAKTLSKFLSLQLVIQALNALSGILIVRTLSKQEYAYFTIANSLQSTMNILADSGVGIALSAIGGKVWNDYYRFGQLINTAMYLRQYLVAIIIIIVTPILFWMLSHAGASIVYTTILIIGILIELYCYLQIGVLSVVLRLKTQIDRIQKLGLIGAGSRLILLATFFRFLSAGIAVFVSTITSVLQATILNRWAKDSVDRNAPINQEDKGQIIKYIGHQIPNSLYYCLEGQLGIFLISTFGNTENIAEIGALSRLSIVFTIISTVVNEIVLPSFSRCQLVKVLFRRYIQVLLLYSLFSFFFILLAYFFPLQFLWILGGNYAHLNEELLFMVISLVVQSILGLIWSMNASKGWILSGWIAFPTGILSKIFLLKLLNLSTVKGVLLLNIFSNLPYFVAFYFTAYIGFKRMSSENLTDSPL